MNSLIDEISSYPFERLRNLIIPTKNKNEINLSIGEPKHQANPRVLEEIIIIRTSSAITHLWQ